VAKLGELGLIVALLKQVQRFVDDGLLGGKMPIPDERADELLAVIG
jgi:hypothetical protein